MSWRYAAGRRADGDGDHDELYDLWLAAEQGKTMAEAEVERLRCCGNCAHFRDHRLDYMRGCISEARRTHQSTRFSTKATSAADHCHFDPPRWKERTP